MTGIKCHFDKLLNRYTPEKVEYAKREMCDQMLMDMTPLVPIDEGTLQGTGHVTSDGIEWNTPYAKKQFYDHRKNKRWDLKAESMYLDNWRKVFVKELMRK